MTTEPGDLELAGRALAVQPNVLPGELEVAVKRANDFAKAEKALNTRRAYTADFAAFGAWCAGRGLSEMPAAAETVAAYLSVEADRGIKASSIGRRVAAISYAHRLAGLPVPTEVEAVRAVIRGIRRTIGTAKEPKAPATNDRLLAMLAARNLESRRALGELRDKALLLLGFAGAFRRSELVALDAADCTFSRDGLTDVAAVENGSGGGGQEGRHSIRRESRDVPRSHDAIVDRAGWHQRRAGIPLHQSAWAGSSRPAERYRCGARGQEAGAAGRA